MNFKFPPVCSLWFYGEQGEPFENSTSRDLDLVDALMLHWPHESGHLVFGLSSHSQQSRWRTWARRNVEEMEKLIRYDLGFDGYNVDITRLTDIGVLCTTEFRWALHVTEHSE
jgi:hypothetical protein